MFLVCSLLEIDWLRHFFSTATLMHPGLTAGVIAVVL